MSRIIVPAHGDHLDWIARNMSRADVEECEAGGKGPFSALRHSLESSVVAWTGLVDEEPVCMFGVSPLDFLGGVGSPWLLGTGFLPRYAMTFLRMNKAYVQKMSELFPHLENYVDARNKLSIRWLKWLGFQFDAQPVPYGIWGTPFYRFWMRG